MRHLARNSTDVAMKGRRGAPASPSSQSEIRTHKRLIDILKPASKTVDALMRLQLPSGVDIEIELLGGRPQRSSIVARGPLISPPGCGRLPGLVSEPPSLAGSLALPAQAGSVHQCLPAPVAHGGKPALPRVLDFGVAEKTRCGVPFDAAPSYGGQAGRALRRGSGQAPTGMGQNSQRSTR